MKMPRSRAVSLMRWVRGCGVQTLPHGDVARRRIAPARLDLVGIGSRVDELLPIRRERGAARELGRRVAVAVQVVLPALDRTSPRAVHELEAELVGAGLLTALIGHEQFEGRLGVVVLDDVLVAVVAALVRVPEAPVERSRARGRV